MARPKKLNADYFSHDADMRNDPKLKALRRKFGIEGYAIWNMMLEVLTDSDDFEYEWSELNIELLSGDFDVEPEYLKEIINYCFKLKLLQNEDDLIFSQKMKSRFESLLSKRNRDRKQYQGDKPTTETPIKTISADEKPQSKVKESKVKEIKERVKENSLAFDLLKNEKSEELTTFEMQNKKHVKKWEDLIDNFNDTVEIELSQGKMEFESEQLMPRLRKYTRSWINNQDNYSKTKPGADDKYITSAPKRF